MNRKRVIKVHVRYKGKDAYFSAKDPWEAQGLLIQALSEMDPKWFEEWLERYRLIRKHAK